MTQVADTAIIHPNVTLGENVIIEDQVIIGISPSGKNLPTIIGNNSHIRAGTIIYEGNTIGTNFQTGNKANIREKNIIGNNVSVGTLSIVEHQVKIEDNVRIHSQVFIPEFSELKKGCWLGPNVVLTNAKYPLSPNVKESLEGPIIHEGAIIGANTTILPGVEVGAHAIVGAGSLVSKNIESNCVAFGSPAKIKKQKTDLPYSE